jgi:hypothetical protein
MTIGHFSPYPTSRSPTSVPQVTGSPSSTVTGKVTRQKRTDRHEDMPRSEATKERVEAKRRYQLAILLAKLQNLYMSRNSSPPETAVPRTFREKGGWSKLKTNNRCNDVREHAGIEPLMYCKEDILTSALVSSENSDISISDVLEEFAGSEAWQLELEALVRSGAPKETLLDCLARRPVLSDLVSRVVDSCARRGGRDWRSPLELHMEDQSMVGAEH